MSAIEFTPANKVADTMPPEERNRTAALLNVGAESADEDAIKLLIDVLFQSVPVKRPLQRGHWFAACRSALIYVQLDTGTVLGQTEKTPLQFHYKIESSSDEEVGAELNPTVKVGPEGAQTEVSVVSLTAKKKTSRGGEIDYSGTENTLEVNCLANSVTWDFSIVRGDRAIRDFLSGNLPLWVDCKPRGTRLKGTIKLLPSIFNFDRDKQPMSGTKSFLMQLALAFRKSMKNDPEKRPILNYEGIHLTFGERK